MRPTVEYACLKGITGIGGALRRIGWMLYDSRWKDEDEVWWQWLHFGKYKSMIIYIKEIYINLEWILQQFNKKLGSCWIERIWEWSCSYWPGIWPSMLWRRRPQHIWRGLFWISIRKLKPSILNRVILRWFFNLGMNNDGSVADHA